MRRPSAPVALLAASVAALLAACPAPPPAKNEPPVLTGPADGSIELGESVVLTATATDPENDPVTFAWELAGKPLGSAPGLTGAQTSTVTFTPDLEGDYALTVTASDGTHDTAPAVVHVTAVKQPFLDGTLVVRVVDAVTGAAIPQAVVRVAGSELQATAGADGKATITDASLTGAITVHVTAPGEVMHDDDQLASTPAVPRAQYRGATIVGAVRAELTVPLHPTGAGEAQVTRGKVRGRIGPELYALLPQIQPMLSFVPDEVSSGQLRAVLVAPLPKKPLSDFEVGDLMGAPIAPEALLPGNLTTDDFFLNSVSSLLGVPDLGEHSLEVFEVDAPAGKQPFLVLGVLVTAQMKALVPLLTGSGTADPGAILGSLEPLTLFAGIVELDVPAGGRTELEAPLTPANLTRIWRTDAQIRTETLRGPWPLDASTEVDLERVVVTPAKVAQAATPERLADPRLAAQLPNYAPVEITNPDGSSKRPKEWEWLSVPEQTGAPATDVAYTVSIAATRLDGAILPLGIAFSRVGDRQLAEASFALPTFDGPLAGASVESITVSMRGLRPAGLDRGFGLLPGVSGQIQELAASSRAAALASAPFPALVREGDDGLDAYVLCEREDTSTTTVKSARAYLDGVNEPYPWSDRFGPDFPTKLAPGAHLAHAVLSHRTTRNVPIDGTSVLVAFEDPSWDVYADAKESLTIPAPPADLSPFAVGDHVQVELRAETYPAPLDMERWSGERLRGGARVFASDTWLGYWPAAE